MSETNGVVNAKPADEVPDFVAPKPQQFGKITHPDWLQLQPRTVAGEPGRERLPGQIAYALSTFFLLSNDSVRSWVDQWANGCRPPWPREAVTAALEATFKALKVERKAQEQRQQLEDAEGYFELYESGDFADPKTFKRGWLVEGLLTEKEPFVIGGPTKTLKTALAVELAVCLASGKPVFGRFPVPEPRRVMVMSSESGGATLQSRAKEVCAAKGLDL